MSRWRPVDLVVGWALLPDYRNTPAASAEPLTAHTGNNAISSTE
ncbi:MAG: hypothetical protein SGI77_23250 [Pirellulaceae bacterium]|nr:hypothetical protein [Pirellulaceae bacterium]